MVGALFFLLPNLLKLGSPLFIIFHMQLFLLSMLTQASVATLSPYLQIIFRNKGYSHSLSGVLIALCQLSAIIMPLMVSSISDKRGKTKNMIILCGILSIILAFPFLLSENLTLVVISAFLLNGFFWCLNPLSDGYINRKLSGDSSRYGLIRAMGTLSYVTALIMFGVTGFPHENDNTSILKCMMIFIPLLVIGASFLKENKRVNEKEEKGKLFSFSWFPKRFYIFMAIVALTRVGQAVVEKLLASYMTENLGLGDSFVLFVALGAIFEFFCMIIFGKLNKKGVLSSTTILTISAIGLTLRLLLYLIPGLPAFIVAQTLHGLTFGALHLCATSYTAANCSKNHYDLGMTLYWSLATNLPEMLGAFLGGFIIDKYGYPMLFFSYSSFPLLAVILSLVFRKTLLGEKR